MNLELELVVGGWWGNSTKVIDLHKERWEGNA